MQIRKGSSLRVRPKLFARESILHCTRRFRWPKILQLRVPPRGVFHGMWSRMLRIIRRGRLFTRGRIGFQRLSITRDMRLELMDRIRLLSKRMITTLQVKTGQSIFLHLTLTMELAGMHLAVIQRTYYLHEKLLLLLSSQLMTLSQLAGALITAQQVRPSLQQDLQLLIFITILSFLLLV